MPCKLRMSVVALLRQDVGLTGAHVREAAEEAGRPGVAVRIVDGVVVGRPV